jgi:hypothetical protein
MAISLLAAVGGGLWLLLARRRRDRGETPRNP